MTNYKIAALALLRIRLNGYHKQQNASPEIVAALKTIEPWLSTWVRPCVEALAGEALNWQKQDIQRQYDQMMRAALATHEATKPLRDEEDAAALYCQNTGARE